MLELKDIHWSVGWNHILKWVNLKVKKSEAIWVVWPNGCGKTSLINMINGFNAASYGTIEFHKQEITKASVEHRASMWIGRVFQSFWIFKELTLYENLALAFVKDLSFIQKILPIWFLPDKITSKIDKVLKEVDLYKKRHELAGSLSGWQMRLLEIARLYLQDMDVYLLDEPTAWVSPKLKWKVIKLIRKIIDSWKSVIIVEHDFNFISQFVDRLVLMEDGEIILDGKYDEIKDSKKMKQVYLWV